MSDKRVLDAFTKACHTECKNMGYDWRIYPNGAWRQMAADVADLAHQKIHKLFDTRLAEFDSYIQNAWPKGVPRDCTKLHDDRDCLERRVRPCKSCATYAQLVVKFEKHER